jgi:hypothetical protein
MQARAISGIVLGLSFSACNAFDDGSGSVSSDAFRSAPPAPAFPWAGGVNSLGTGQLALSGELEGELRGITLDGVTSDNVGSYDLYEGGGGSLYMSIAARGAPAGAGMLIVNIMDPELRSKLGAGRWSSSDPLAEGLAPAVSIGSCAGPNIGEWPYETGATEYEVEATEDPERPGTIAVLVKAQFPRNDIDFSDTTELGGTLRFDQLDWPE